MIACLLVRLSDQFKSIIKTREYDLSMAMINNNENQANTATILGLNKY